MGTAVFTQDTKPSTAIALNKNTGHSVMCVFSTRTSATTTEFWPKTYLVFVLEKGFSLTNGLWIQWELDSFASEPKSITYRLFQVQDRQLL